MDKTKEQILAGYIHWEMSNPFNGDTTLTIPVEYAKEAMEEYAKQKCIEFGVWIYIYGYQHSYDTSNWYHVTDNAKTLTTKELYNEFLLHQQNPTT